MSCVQQSTNVCRSIYESNALYITGAVLDPRFRLQWCQQNEIEDIKATIVCEMQSYAATSSASTESQSHASSSSSSTSSVHSHSTPGSPSQLDYANDPLVWWRSHASDFPQLARTAKTVLSIPASSEPVECIFSKPTAGKIFRRERSRLTPEKFENLVFIKCNKRVSWLFHWQVD